MNKVLVKESTLKNIADAIREKHNTYYFQMLPSEMPGSIAGIDTEKVTIDGRTVTEDLDLVSYSNTIEEAYTSALLPNQASFGKKYILNDGNLLYLKTNSSPFSVTLSYVRNDNIEHISSSITIAGDNQTGDYSAILHQSEDNKIWLEIRRKNEFTNYFSVYEIIVNNSTLSSINKCLNIQSYYYGKINVNVEILNKTLVDSTGLYAVELEDKYENPYTITTYSITTYQFGTSNTKMKKIGNSFRYDNYNNWMNSKAFCKMGSTYYYFYRKDCNDGDGYDNYCSVTRNSATNFSKADGTLSTIKVFTRVYEYNNSLYGIDENRNIYQFSSNDWVLKNTLSVNIGYISDMEYTLSGRPYRAINVIEDKKYNYQYNMIKVSLPYSLGDSYIGPTLNTYRGGVPYSFEDCYQFENYLIYYFKKRYHFYRSDLGEYIIYDEYIKLYVNQDGPSLYKRVL